MNLNYSFLFSSMNGSNSNNNNNMFYSINLSDYATIKNGSYGKLMNAYYSKMESQTSPSDDENDVNTDKNNYVDSSKKQEVTDLQKSVDELQASASKLLKEGSASLFKTDDAEYTESDKKALYNAISDFVSDYNAMVEKGDDSSFSSIANMTGRMERTVSDHQNALAEIGISLEQGKLTINKDSFMNADMEQVKELFNGNNSFAEFIYEKTKTIENGIGNVARRNNIDIEAIKKETSTSASSSSSNTANSENSADSVYKKEMTTMKKYADELENAANALLKTGENSLFKTEYAEEDKEALYKAVSDFVSDFNTVLENGKASTVKTIVNMTERMKDSADDYKESLSEIGISVEEKKLTIDKDSFMNADMEQVKKLFNETNSFGYFTSQKAETMESTANNEANRNNLYTKNGTYNNISAGILYSETI